MQNFRNLKIWQKAHQIVLEIYKLTQNYPTDKRFGLTSQMRRSAASVPTNIAEGSVRSSDLDFARFLYIALGSAAELDYQLELSHDLEYLAHEPYEKLRNELDELMRMLNAFIQRLEKSR